MSTQRLQSGFAASKRGRGMICCVASRQKWLLRRGSDPHPHTHWAVREVRHSHRQLAGRNRRGCRKASRQGQAVLIAKGNE